MNKQSTTAAALRILDGAYGSLTFGEIAGKINDTKAAIQKALHYLYKEGRVSRAQDADGIVHYNITEKGKARLNGEAEPELKTLKDVVQKENTSVIKPSYTEAKPSTTPWAQLVEEAEQRGFAQGYAEGVKTAQVQAYQDAKLDIVKRLVGVVT